MTITYITRAELNQFINATGNFDTSVRNALITSLEHQGVYDPLNNGMKAWFETDTSYAGGPVSPIVQVLDVKNSTTVQTDATLKGIIMDDAGGNHLFVTDLPNAHNNVFVAMGTGGDTVNLFDSGNDTVYGGSGNDAIGGGVGNSSLFGGAGDDSIYGGSGHDTLDGGAGDDYLQAGTGQQTLLGGAGNDTLRDISGGHDVLDGGGGSGSDTLFGVQGDVLQDKGNKSSANVFWVNANTNDPTASSTLIGGAGNDQFHIETHQGNDTVIGGGGNDILGFAGRNTTTDIGPGGLTYDATTKTYTLTFTDNQKISIQGVSDLYFAGDGQTIHLTY